MNIRAIVVDDESDGRSVLLKLLNKHCQKVNVLGEADDIDVAYKLIMETSPDVVFLDIQMPRGNAFSLLKRFETIPFETIFVTSYNQYAIQAIKMCALDYLLKPIDVNELISAVSKVEYEISVKQHKQEQIANLLSQIHDSKLDKKIAVHHNSNVIFINLNQIIFFQSERNYTDIFLFDGKSYNSSKNLGEFEDLLVGHSSFIRLNKTVIINMNYIESYNKGYPCFISIVGGHVFEVSRRRKNEILEGIKGDSAKIRN